MFLFLPLQEAAAFTFSLASGRGLAISVSGVPIVQSSAFQFYEPGWTKGYYSSNNGPQTVRTIDADTQEMAFVSSDKLASGSERVHRLGNTLIAHFHFEWKGPHPAQVEVAPGMLWAPAFQAGTLTADAKPTRPLTVTKYNSDTDMQEAVFARRHELRIGNPICQHKTYEFDSHDPFRRPRLPAGLCGRKVGLVVRRPVTERIERPPR